MEENNEHDGEENLPVAVAEEAPVINPQLVPPPPPQNGGLPGGLGAAHQAMLQREGPTGNFNSIIIMLPSI